MRGVKVLRGPVIYYLPYPLSLVYISPFYFLPFLLLLSSQFYFPSYNCTASAHSLSYVPSFSVIHNFFLSPFTSVCLCLKNFCASYPSIHQSIIFLPLSLYIYHQEDIICLRCALFCTPSLSFPSDIHILVIN